MNHTYLLIASNWVLLQNWQNSKKLSHAIKLRQNEAKFVHFYKISNLCPASSKLMMTSSNGNIFRITCPLCREFTGPGELPAQRPVTQSFDVFFDLRLNKRLSKQPWDWWFEMPSWSLWRQCNVKIGVRDSKLWSFSKTKDSSSVNIMVLNVICDTSNYL